MSSTFVLDAPAGIGGSGRVRASGWACPTALAPAAGPRVQRLRGTALPAPEPEVTGGAMSLGTGVLGAQQPAATTSTPDNTPTFGTTPYSTLGNHSPGRPQS